MDRKLTFQRVAVLGATGPTGRTLVDQWDPTAGRLRVVGRDEGRLSTVFPDPAIEKRAADALEPETLRAALDGCDLVIDCVGLPAAQMPQHPRVARHLADALRATGARAVQVSSYWSYIPIRGLPVQEDAPRTGGPDWARWRRGAEDILAEAGAAVVQFPDFFGPGVHTSTLQQPIREALAGKPMNWIGSADVKRDYLFLPDGMRRLAALATRPEAFGRRWIVPGSGPTSGAEVARRLEKVLGRRVRLRAAGPALLRVVSWFKRDLRGFLPMVPTYTAPLSFDGQRLESLLGPALPTPYDEAFVATIAAERAHAPAG